MIMTEKYKILGKYIKDMSSETPDTETYIFVKDRISKYQLGIDINSTGKNRTGWNGGYTSLLIATQYEHIDIVKYLLTFDHININASNDSGMSALHTAAYHNTNHEITQMFIMHPNLNINSQNSQGWTSVCIIFMYT